MNAAPASTPSVAATSTLDSQAAHVLSNEPDSAIHSINYQWSMKDLQDWSKAKQDHEKHMAAGLVPEAPKAPLGPLMFGGRIWWSAAARLSSILVLLLAIVAESLVILRDATARITRADSGERESGNEADSSGLRMLSRRAAASKHKSNPDLTQCQWVKDTDVQNNSMGIATAILYHMLTTGILAILVMAEFQIWSWRLHASATLNIGIVQLWAGFAMISRAINDTFGQIVGWALVLAGASNMAFGFMDRFTLGGPGLMLFGTGIRIAQNPNSEGSDKNSSAGGRRSRRRHHEAKPPHPELELLESEKAAMISQQRAHAGHKPMPWEYRAAGFTTRPLESDGGNGRADAVSEVPAEMRSFVEQLAAKHPAGYQQLSAQWAAFERKAPTPSTASSSLKTSKSSKPATVHFAGDLLAGGNQPGKSAKGKKWKNRMSHDL